MQKFGIKKTAVLIAPVILLSGLNFCFVNIQTSLGAVSDSPETVIANARPAAESCAGNHSLASTTDSPTIKEKSDSATNNTKDSLPPCCLNHDNAAKIEAVRNQETDNSSQPLATENYYFNYNSASAGNFSTYFLGLSPPPGDLLSSIVKKE